MATLLQKHLSFVERWKSDGSPTRSFQTPCCETELEVPVPDSPNEQWDSLMKCPHCDELFMKIATSERAWGVR